MPSHRNEPDADMGRVGHDVFLTCRDHSLLSDFELNFIVASSLQSHMLFGAAIDGADKDW